MNVKCFLFQGLLIGGKVGTFMKLKFEVLEIEIIFQFGKVFKDATFKLCATLINFCDFFWRGMSFQSSKIFDIWPFYRTVLPFSVSFNSQSTCPSSFSSCNTSLSRCINISKGQRSYGTTASLPTARCAGRTCWMITTGRHGECLTSDTRDEYFPFY